MHLSHLARSSTLIVLHREKKATNYYEVYVSVLIVMIFSVCSSGLAIVAAAVLITTDQSSILFGQKTYPTVESGQRILLDTKSGLNKNLTIDEVQLMGPVLLILKADISQDKDFMLLGYNNNSISLYQY